MSEAEKQLLQLLKERSFQRGSFRLASGATSDYYIDGRMTAVFSAGAYWIGETLYEHTRDLEVDAIGGLEVGAVPLTAAVVISYHLHGQKMEGFWVRDKIKTHGTQKLIEGNVKAPARVVIVEDVITQGSSSLKAIEAVRASGCDVVRVVALLDRLCGAKDRLQENGIGDYRSVFTIRDLGAEP
jgi:orotate phosphoribosyltransferase